ncbi:50S ribosomal protein L11 methyltransferase [Seohaeicola nanhaiensis]|uniref:Ribosomal protein L11 methyltransferase n=1 Tax=Seohaeicola nanhaiensis TaxID=1387282 RepID=A0ABV9KJD0_9RHOB
MTTTYTALTTLTGKAPAEALGEAMEALTPEPTGVGVFEMEDGSGLWEVGGYFTEAPDEIALALLAAAHGAKPFTVSEVPETDWVAHVRRELAPVVAGRFFVYGSHDADKVPADAVPLLIEAAMAFGTGHHGTTLGCLKALDKLAGEGFAPGAVADIGCGTAVLAMAAARVWPDATVVASDIDPVAVEVAVSNLRANGMEGAVECLEAAGFGHPGLSAAAPYDLIFANILKGPLIALAPDLAANLRPGGIVILSGILADQADEVAGHYSDAGINPLERGQIGDWITLVGQKNA